MESRNTDFISPCVARVMLDFIGIVLLSSASLHQYGESGQW